MAYLLMAYNNLYAMAKKIATSVFAVAVCVLSLTLIWYLMPFTITMASDNDWSVYGRIIFQATQEELAENQNKTFLNEFSQVKVRRSLRSLPIRANYGEVRITGSLENCVEMSIRGRDGTHMYWYLYVLPHDVRTHKVKVSKNLLLRKYTTEYILIDKDISSKIEAVLAAR